MIKDLTGDALKAAIRRAIDNEPGVVMPARRREVKAAPGTFTIGNVITISDEPFVMWRVVSVAGGRCVVEELVTNITEADLERPA